MKQLLQQGAKAIARLLSPYPANEKALAIRGALVPAAAFASSATGADRSFRVAIQLVEDPFYFALFGAIFAQLRKTHRAIGELVVIRATSGAIGTGWRAWLMRSVPMAWILTTQWVRAYAGLVNRVAFRSHSWNRPVPAWYVPPLLGAYTARIQ